ncbi:MAG: hypothetical protein CM15mP62_31460 [Rhodospirillaceae bacterium]|nr:MAG: hypothetical protein CM15mP62_31460 [Rhodospirillaceae bacterium]
MINRTERTAYRRTASITDTRLYKFDERRILVGRIETGSLSIGDTLLFSPSNKTANVSSFETWNETITPETLSAGRSVAFTLDEQIFVERGHIASDPKSPPFETNIFKARLFWLAEKPLVKSCRMTLKLHYCRILGGNTIN